MEKAKMYIQEGIGGISLLIIVIFLILIANIFGV